MAAFEWFEYKGNDKQFTEKLPENGFRNPILAGFYPDPSITRKGDDYYLVTSSFAYTPGLPIFHSKDLVHWEQVGHALSRPSQVEFAGLGLSRGIFAPTLRYHEGTFYLITTAVDAGGNFIITAKDPAGPWSDPIWLPEVGGIDPDIFFDGNGKAYITHNDEPPGTPLYEGHRALWMWELNLDEMKVVKGSRKLLVNGGVDLSAKPVWIEGPHIYKINGWYYLISAEGGTSVNHSVVVFRTRSLDSPFVPYKNNPILTQRDVKNTRVTSTGHADLIQTPDGNWWSVFLATRPYQENLYNTGRETYLLPVTWKDGWPHYLESKAPVPVTLAGPIGMQAGTQWPLTGNGTWRDNFDTTKLKPQWLGLNTFNRDWLTLADGKLQMAPITTTITDPAQSAFIGRRQQHQTFTATTQVQVPEDGIAAGLLVLQNRQANYFFAVRKEGQSWQGFVEKVVAGNAQNVASVALNVSAGELLQLKVEGNKGSLQFFIHQDGDHQDKWSPVGDAQDASILSTEKAGGFVGAMVGLHVREQAE